MAAPGNRRIAVCASMKQAERRRAKLTRDCSFRAAFSRRQHGLRPECIPLRRYPPIAFSVHVLHWPQPDLSRFGKHPYQES